MAGQLVGRRQPGPAPLIGRSGRSAADSGDL